MTVRYTTNGPVRGCCGHAHTKLRCAVECFMEDNDGCSRQGGHSDRWIYRLDGEVLSDAEHEFIIYLLAGEKAA